MEAEKGGRKEQPTEYRAYKEGRNTVNCFEV
jgi:hypothetical protein